jgi:cell cycle arrest protein BUB2
MASKPHPQISNTAASSVPPQALPSSPRKLRRFQSHQTLSSNSFQLTNQQPATSQSSTPQIRQTRTQNEQLQNGSTDRAQPYRRIRSNSDLGAGSTTPLVTQRRPARKTGSLGLGGKRSNLENLLREGPPTGKLAEALHDLRYLVLSARVEADSDGMVSRTCLIWKTALLVRLYRFLTPGFGTVNLPHISVVSTT